MWQSTYARSGDVEGSPLVLINTAGLLTNTNGLHSEITQALGVIKWTRTRFIHSANGLCLNVNVHKAQYSF